MAVSGRQVSLSSRKDSENTEAMDGTRVCLPVVDVRDAGSLAVDSKRYIYVCPGLKDDEELGGILEILPITKRRPCRIPSPANQRSHYILGKQRRQLRFLDPRCEIDTQLRTVFKRLLMLDGEEGTYTRSLDGMPCRGTCEEATRLKTPTSAALGWGKEHGVCGCYQNSLLLLRNSRPPFNTWESARHRQTFGPDRLAGWVLGDRLQNQSTQFPLSTLVTRWTLKKNNSYTIDQLHEVFRAFGKVTAIVLKTNNSAFVVYDELADACKAKVNTRLGRHDNPLSLTWWHSHMSNKFFGVGTDGGSLKVKTNKHTALRDYRM